MEPDPDVLDMVRRQLDRDPPPSTEALYGRAARINDQIYGLSLRQFNATYVLRVKRERKRAERERERRGREPAVGSSPAGEPGGAAREEEGGDDGGSDDDGPRPGGFLEKLREAEADGEAEDSASAGTGGGGEGVSEAGRRPLRERIRGVLWGYARQVAGAGGMAGAVAAVEAVDERVDDIVELAGLAGREPAAD